MSLFVGLSLSKETGKDVNLKHFGRERLTPEVVLYLDT